RKRGCELHTFYSGIPASTPAVQGELHYGRKCAVPAFSFLDRRAGRIGMMMYPEWAKRIEADLSSQATGLLTGGSSWSNIYTGGAGQQESHFCAASVGLGDMWTHTRFRAVAAVVLLHIPAFIRLFGLLALELALGLYEAMRGIAGHGRSIAKELSFLIARVFVCVGLRELITVGGSVDVSRGLPIVHVNFLGYDEQSHRRGPGSAFAHWTLRGIDRCIRRLHRAARISGRRDYEVWIFSDHGQVRTTQAGKMVEGGLEGLIRKHWKALAPGSSSDGTMRRQRTPSPGHWLGGRRAGRREYFHAQESELTAFEKEEFAVAALGPVGHVYFGKDPGAATIRKLAAALIADGVPGILIRRSDGGADWLSAEGEDVIPAGSAFLPHNEKLRDTVAGDLALMCHNEHAGDMVVLGFGPGGTSWTFAEENGSHAGPAPEETQAFALLPRGVWLPPESEEFIRPSALRQAALHLLNRSDGPPSEKRRARPWKPRKAEHLRVVTYNVHGCLGTDGLTSPARIARVLEPLHADIIALQEIDSGRGRSHGLEQLREIAGAVGMHARFFPTVTYSDGSYGHGVLCRSPIALVHHDRLPAADRGMSEPRSAAWVRFHWGDREVNFIATHLGLGGRERLRQVRQILGESWLGGIPKDDAVIFCGDLNLAPGSPGYRHLAAQLRDVQAHAPGHVAKKTFPSLFPLLQLDHVFVSKQLEIVHVDVVRDARTAVASDHLPLVVDLMLEPAAEGEAEERAPEDAASARPA
ncbi:MAG: endonuclease/exonuclease/phosphatase family protein, partial [Opitutaceae bacterium]